ncbi:MAG TPA: hypothetical protein VFJ70_19490 [Burkholderiales bacterium]|nr:hypothetical protein [Burkholderiales bacterium]
MNTMATAFKSDRARAWTRERLDSLSRDELVNLQTNAERLGEQELAALCTALLEERPRRGAPSAAVATRLKGRPKLIPRTRAFEARGVWLYDPRTSWSGVRKNDGTIVIALWHAAVKSRDGGCSCLLWAPNVDGARPWSDSPAGRERLEHCKLAIERHGAEGLLVYGQSLEGRLPEERATTVLGIDAETVIRFQVEMRGAEYWACWGKKTA